MESNKIKKEQGEEGEKERGLSENERVGEQKQLHCNALVSTELPYIAARLGGRERE